MDQSSDISFQSPASEIPRLCFIADGFIDGSQELTKKDVQARTVDLVKAGVPWVQLRDHDATPGVFEREARRFVDVLRNVNSEVSLSLNGSPECVLDVAGKLGIGVHLGRRGPSVNEAKRVTSGRIGYSAHSMKEVLYGEKAGADYVSFSPVFPTRSHPGAFPTGVDFLREAAQACRIPVFALGGMTPQRACAARKAGAYGVSGVSCLLLVRDPEQAVRRFLTALSRQ